MKHLVSKTQWKVTADFGTVAPLKNIPNTWFSCSASTIAILTKDAISSCRAVVMLMALIRQCGFEKRRQWDFLSGHFSRNFTSKSIRLLNMDFEDDALYPQFFCCTVVLKCQKVYHHPPPAYDTVSESRIPRAEASSTISTPFSESGTTLVEPPINPSWFRQHWLSLLQRKLPCCVRCQKSHSVCFST